MELKEKKFTENLIEKSEAEKIKEQMKKQSEEERRLQASRIVEYK